jgi:2-polyprenyl-3-methyl-5-hydroxy-6-metoxy-1,4-benzoquinol methylase
MAPNNPTSATRHEPITTSTAHDDSGHLPRHIGRRLEIIQRAAPLRGKRLLDIGCGRGEFATVMSTRFEQVHAIDLDQDRLNEFRGTNPPKNVVINQFSAEDLPFEDCTFDRVTAIEMIEHVDHVPGVLREVQRVLRPGGYFAITTPNRPWSKLSRMRSVHHYSDTTYQRPGHSLENLIIEAGLQPYAAATMFSPVDRIGMHHPLHRVIDRLESTPVGIMAQTLVLVARRA